MNEYLKNRKLSFLLASILYLALGLVLLIWPGTATTVICYAFGAVLAIYGLVAIISFFVSRKGGFAFELFLGIVAAFTPLIFASGTVYALTFLISMGVAALCALCMRRFHLKWLGSFIMSISLIVSMAASVLLEQIF